MRDDSSTSDRAGAADVVDRLERNWAILQRGGIGTDKADEEFAADLTALQGFARTAALSDVTLLARKLADVVAVVRAQKYKVSMDAEIVTTMALQFIAMLVRRKSGTSTGGIDLVGFVRQMDDVLRTERAKVPNAAPAPLPPTGPGPAPRPTQAGMRPVATTREPPPPPALAPTAPKRDGVAPLDRIAIAATQVYLESLRSAPAVRFRLRETWMSLVGAMQQLNASQSSAPRESIPVHVFPAARGVARLAVPTEWSVSVSSQAAAAARDPLDVLGVWEGSDTVAPASATLRGLRFLRDTVEVSVLAGGPPDYATAIRTAPTPADHPVEVVEIDGTDAVLVRPDALQRMMNERRAKR